MPKSSDFIDRLVERLDRLDPSGVQGYILRLARERGLLNTVFQSIREGVLIIDRELRIHFANNAAIGMLGLPEDERQLERQHIHRYLRDIDWDRLMSQDPNEWERVSRQEIEIAYPRRRFLQFYLLPYRNHSEVRDAEWGMMIMILHDVTELRLRTESTIESERLNAVTMLAGAVAHELGNPLNSMSIHLELLDEYFAEHGDDERAAAARKHLDTALEEVDRLDSIINQFLKAIRPTPLDPEPVDLRDVINETLEFLAPELDDREIQVQCEYAEDVPAIHGDPRQLRQAFYNLIGNAMNAMPGGGALRIVLQPTRKKLELSFIDSGHGIKAEDIGRIFDPYFTTRAHGTGLGLVVVERILREHGATLAVESEVGAGSVFRIEFPRSDTHARLLEPPADSNQDS